MRKHFSFSSIKKRSGKVCLFVLCIFLLVFIRLFWLQVVSGSELSKRATLQSVGDEQIFSPRGSILDRNGEELAVSIMSKSLYVDPQEMEDKPELWERGKKPVRNPRRLAADLLAPVLKMDAERLFSDFNYSGRFLWIKRTLEPNEAAAVKQIIKEHKLSGLHFLEESKRYYTKNTMAAHVLGFVGVDDNGLSGIEWSLDSILKGAENSLSETVDALGRPIVDSALNSATPPRMATVYLTIDNKMQHVLEKGLDDALAKTNAKSASVILMDPNTGAILGMASRPTFDPNKFGEYPAEALVNRAISIIYEPGSVFKPIVGCAGLSEQVVTPTSPYFDTGAFQVADRTIRNWDREGMGVITFTDVIKYSVNTGMADLGMKLGAQKMNEYTKKFGFGTATGIELPGEEDGILYDSDAMRLPDIATMSIGQGIAVTPLQMLRAICSIANGGELVKPYIVEKIILPNGKVLREGKKETVRRVMTEEVAGQMRSMMEQVVASGGGKTARIEGYKIAGKTGTAEKLSEHGGYAAGVYIASFVGFVPSDNPQYAMLIMLDSPQGAFYGSQVSAPVFRDTLQQILVAQGVQPSNSVGLPSFDALTKKDFKVSSKAKPQIVFMPDGKVKIPDFTDLNIRQVAEVIAQGNLSLIPHGSGIAKRQSVPTASLVEQGTTIEVWFE
ncbi:MAG TPA: peptidoglycan glycosyltransferase [Candidatus Avacidaminococcus intestinavium]|uniref:Peptidoglycan glycosyltransferase n=1 Tax=Candidatus Avacidaminococcus intestinavium TaxID=2840684 RepID=A0A9D1MR66_9FIRM|nr:peptidoglycan glycosyltransferase [Candidatus Avacidaminococcus intestinavium]